MYNIDFILQSQIIGTGSIKRKGPENLKLTDVDSSVLNESIVSKIKKLSIK